ncbi:MAG: helix-turn-helix transcriptional regulator [Firmicutes bacterium]|nr:helix-turn-helix transcriptional regulator [Bacillota bacterium]
MGKKSTKENKNVYQLSREALELTRDAASEVLEFISPERIEKIESGKTIPHPDEVLAMEEGYKNPELCNYYCTHECPIGMQYVPEAKLKDFSQVTIDIIAAVNSLVEEKDRLIGIAVDGRVNDFERKDFDAILKKLDNAERSIQGMKIWIKHAAASGKLDEAK